MEDVDVSLKFGCYFHFSSAAFRWRRSPGDDDFERLFPATTGDERDCGLLAYY